MEEKLLLYRVDTKYINYLKRYQKHIWDNDDKGYIRPYVGVIVKVSEYKYYVPLSSPKEKHKKMKNSLDFVKVIYKNELKAVLNINNIIPVDDSDISLVDIDNEKEDYKDLLNAEMIFIRKNSKLITNNARSIYEKITKYKSENLSLAKRCYDFKLLEEKMEEYQDLKRKSEESLVAVTTTDKNVQAI